MPRRLARIAGSCLFLSALLLTVLVGCNNNDHDNNGVPQPGLPSTRSSSIALSKSGNFLVVANPDVNTISVFQPTTLAKLGEITVGTAPESVAVHESVPTAFVANSLSGTVSVVTLPSGPVRQTIPVGKGPMGVAVSPNGTRLYVANSADNTLSVLDANTYASVATVDLAAHGGTSPRAIAVTDDGDADDADETVFVAMFFANLRPGKTAVEEGQDDQREGHVIAVSAATNTVIDHVPLAPMAVTGFNSNGQLAPGPAQVPAVASANPQAFATPTAAFPNQLASIAIHPTTGLGYVVSTGASPNGPLRFNQMVQGLVSVFDVAALTEVTAAQTGATVRQEAPLNLNRGINLDTAAVPRLFLSNPVAMAWRPNGNDAWVVIQNSDVVVRLTADGTGAPTIGTPLVAGPGQIVRVDLQAVSGSDIAGKAPRGIVITADGKRAFVHNFISRSLTAIDITEGAIPAILGTAQSTAPPATGSAEATRQLGAELFFTGRGPNTRMSAESWGGCIVCHPNGRTDNVTWMFDAGPRQTIPLDGMFSKSDPTDQRILNWSAVRDENHDFELNTRGVFGGRGLIDDDRLFFVIGGASGATPDDSTLVEQFQQVTGAIGTTNDLAAGQALPALPSGRRDFAVATLDDARVFVIGGRSGAGQGSLVGAADAVLEFNPRTNSLVPKSSTGFTLRYSLGAAAVKTSAGTRIYAVGGYASTLGTDNPVATVEEYNPTTDTWRAVASLPQAVAQFGITVAGGINAADPVQLLHVSWGNAASENTPAVAGSTFAVQRFLADPAGTGAWNNFAVTGLTPRRLHGAATALRGVAARVFVVGGVSDTGVLLASVEEYTNAATPAAVVATHTNLPAERAHFAISSSLSTNQIYVVGGVDSLGNDAGSILEYTIANNGAVAGPAGTPSGTWVPRGDLPTALRGLGLSTPPPVTNFLPARSAGRDLRQDAIAAWVATIKTAPAPTPADQAAVDAGRTLFGQVGLVVTGFSCATCHGGPKWTRSRVDYTAPPSPVPGPGLGEQRVIGAELRETALQPNNPGPIPLPQFPGVLLNVGTFTLAGGRTNEIRFNGADISQAIAPLGANGFNIPSLLSVNETAPYFYSGLAQTLDQVLDGSQDGNGGVRHHFVTLATDRTKLIAFLRSIDDKTTVFP